MFQFENVWVWDIRFWLKGLILWWKTVHFRILNSWEETLQNSHGENDKIKMNSWREPLRFFRIAVRSHISDFGPRIIFRGSRNKIIFEKHARSIKNCPCLISRPGDFFCTSFSRLECTYAAYPSLTFGWRNLFWMTRLEKSQQNCGTYVRKELQRWTNKHLSNDEVLSSLFSFVYFCR